MPTATTDRIVAAAKDIVIREGSAALTMRRVGDAVGLTSMAIYRHHRSREELLAEVASSCFADLAVQWAGYRWSGGVGEEMDQLVDAHVDFALEQPMLYTFLFTEQRGGARRFPEDFRNGGSPTLNVVADGLTAGIRDGIYADHDVWEVALGLAAQLHGLAQLYHGGRIAIDAPEFRAVCRRAVRRNLDALRR